ncbi:MAG: right-handed parallel beta-helix repeat-containing protein [Phycisphaerales bacterium]|nr:MAG: right-handed parallel beta-helix repeat-containing protein [Phycisphaerales bacterium]
MCQTSTRSLRRPLIIRPAAVLVLCITLGVGAAERSPQQDPNEADAVTATNRPLREPQAMVLTVDQGEGDLQGKDDKVIQAGIEYLNRLGGGTLRLGPGVYLLRNCIYLSSNITLQGAGQRTILRKAPSVVTPLVRDSDWFEYGVQVDDPTGFVPGGGIMLRTETGPEDWQYDVLQATVTAIQGDVVYLDGSTQENFWVDDEATATTIFPLLAGEGADDVTVADLVLDGNRQHNEHVNGNFAGAVFIQNCNAWHFENVTARNYNGDGFSFQACDDIEFVNCHALNNADLGFHPGSGSQRPVFENCVARGNREGIFFCWSVSDGLVDNCTLAENSRYGISIGHRDTDNVIARCTIERNGQVGILFRDEDSEFRSGHRNRIEQCTLRDNGAGLTGIGVDIRGRTRDVTIRQSRFENGTDGSLRVGIRIGKLARQIVLEDNTFENVPTEIQDHRLTAIQSK